jgi:hypothetical protein
MWQHADVLAAALVATQNVDGSWFKTRNCDSLAPVGTPPLKWEGDIAWATYALSRYLTLRGHRPAVAAARNRAANWMAGRLSATDGCLQIDHTEATIDAWWALQSAGRTPAADGLKDCLLRFYWDDQMGRFKGGKNWRQPYLDNQTWGAAFLSAIGETEKARRALSYARHVLLLPSQGGQAFGFDGQGGPWSMWNEGIAQYIAVGGMDSTDLLEELLAQQRADGAVPGSPDDFSGGGVWTTQWGGVAPTAWLYNAVNCEPFTPNQRERCTSYWLPLLRAGP